MKIFNFMLSLLFITSVISCTKMTQRAEDRFAVRVYPEVQKNIKYVSEFIEKNNSDSIKKEISLKFKNIKTSDIDDFYLQWKRVQVISQGKDDVYLIFGFRSSDKSFDTKKVLIFVKENLSLRLKSN